MKKRVVMLLLVSMMTVCTGCGADASQYAEIAGQMSQVEQSGPLVSMEGKPGFREKMAETDAENQEEAESQVGKDDNKIQDEAAVSATKEELQAVLDQKADGLWAIDLSEKIANWTSGNVILHIETETEGGTSLIEMNTLGNKVYMSTAVQIPDSEYYSDPFVMVVIYDGENSYMVDTENEYYCTVPMEQSELNSEVNQYMMRSEYTDCFIEAGIEEVNGCNYLYEKYELEEMGEMKYYFNQNGDICGISQNIEGVEQFIKFTTEFCDEKDESVFIIPDDYIETNMGDLAYNLI